MPINADQIISILLNWEDLISIDHLTIDLYWEVFWINSKILIGIDRYCSALGIDQGSPVQIQ